MVAMSTRHGTHRLPEGGSGPTVRPAVDELLVMRAALVMSQLLGRCVPSPSNRNRGDRRVRRNASTNHRPSRRASRRVTATRVEREAVHWDWIGAPAVFGCVQESSLWEPACGWPICWRGCRSWLIWGMACQRRRRSCRRASSRSGSIVCVVIGGQRPDHPEGVDTLRDVRDPLQHLGSPVVPSPVSA